VAANLAAVASDVTGEYNIGTGRRRPSSSLVEALGRLAGRPFDGRVRAGAARRGAPHRASTASKAKAELGWEARVEIEEGLAQTLSSWPLTGGTDIRSAGEVFSVFVGSFFPSIG